MRTVFAVVVLAAVCGSAADLKENLKVLQASPYTCSQDVNFTGTTVQRSGADVVTTSSTSTLTNKTIDADGTGNSLTNIENANIKVGAAIDAAKIHDGSVSNTEFGYLNGVTSALQGQIDAKLASTDATKLNFAAATELTISSGSVTITQSAHTVDGEGDANDDLDTISGGTEGDLVVLYPENSARDITLKHATGNIVTGDGNDYTIPDNGLVVLYYDGSNWRLVAGGGGSGYVETSNATQWFSVSFTIPDEPDNDPQHFQIEIDDNADFSSPIVDHDSRDVGDGGDGQSGCLYFNGTQWASWTSATGVTSAYEGERGSYTFQSSSISRGTVYYCRIRFHDGTAWGDYAGEVKTW